MANRASRRHPVPLKVAANGEVGDQGEFVYQLPQPERVGDLTVTEAAEVKRRNDQMEWIRQQAKNFTDLLTVADTEKQQFIRDLCQRKNLDVTRANFNLDLQLGAIWKTAELRKAAALEPIAVSDEQPAQAE